MKILLLGGTGAMGGHLARILAERGDEVVITSRSERVPRERIEYVKGDAKDAGFLSGLLAEKWDAVVDFMVWATADYKDRCPHFLSTTDQYVFVSSYRVYADTPIIAEDSPRLLDVSDDRGYLATDEYALAKARSEDMLESSGRTNWTIVRPAITYDGSGRFQLAVHEAGIWLWRALHGVPVPLPGEMLGKQATMTWGGDVARMMAALIGNPRAHGEAFTVSTSEHRSWSDIADIYRRVVPGLNVCPCPLSQFERERGGVYQIRYDRMFDRRVDNSKVLEVTGIDPKSLMTIDKGLTSELSRYLREKNAAPIAYAGEQARMDRLVGGSPSLLPILRECGGVATVKYTARRYFDRRSRA